MEAADSIRDVLIQYAGTSVVKAGEEIIRCDLTTSPYFHRQDEQERVISAVGFRGVAQTRVRPHWRVWGRLRKQALERDGLQVPSTAGPVRRMEVHHLKGRDRSNRRPGLNF